MKDGTIEVERLNRTQFQVSLSIGPDDEGRCVAVSRDTLQELRDEIGRVLRGQIPAVTIEVDAGGAEAL